MNTKLLFFFISLWFFGALFTSCSILKTVPPNKSLLIENTINFEGVEQDVIKDFFFKDEIYEVLAQKPNHKFLGLPLSLWIWNYYSDKKITKFNQWMKNNLGSEPIIYDSLNLEKSRIRLENLYFNNGYLNNKVYTTVITEKKKTKNIYTVVLKDDYKIRNIYLNNNSPIEKIINQNIENSLLKKGDDFNITNLKEERQRIANLINDKGYYFFNKEFVQYKLDTFFKTKEMDIYLNILKENDSIDFETYRIDTTKILISANIEDSISFNAKTINHYLKFYQESSRGYNEQFLSRFFRSDHDSLYSRSDNQLTLQNLSGLNNFKLINSNYIISDRKNRKLDAIYTLTPLQRHYFSVGQYLYNNFESVAGSNISLQFTDRNLTKRADKLQLTFSAALELNFGLKNTLSNNIISRNDFSVGAKYTIEKFMLPYIYKDPKNFLYTRTNLGLNFTYENRINYYKLYNISSTNGYEWARKSNLRFSYNPLAIGLILVPDESLSESFKEILAKNPFLRASFLDNLILGSNFNLTFDWKSRKKHSNYRFNLYLETAGNIPYLFNKITNGNTHANKLFQLEISQYAKILPEFLYSRKLNSSTSINSRLKFGVALPYGNSRELPYIKQFYVGGPYSLRAFTLRSIGPGAFDVRQFDSSGIAKDQTGNFLLETNIEYRFDIIKYIKGAVFLDAGNVWMIRSENSLGEASIFKIEEFYKQLYMGTGVGLRFDIDYFVIRLDVGVPLRVPYLSGSDAWVIKNAQPFNSNWVKSNMILNIGVGYPF